MSKTILIDGLEYDRFRRLKYNPEFHENHKKDWTTKEIIYLCKMKDTMKWSELSLALGRTHTTCATKYHELKKQGLLGYYKNL